MAKAVVATLNSFWIYSCKLLDWLQLNQGGSPPWQSWCFTNWRPSINSGFTPQVVKATTTTKGESNSKERIIVVADSCVPPLRGSEDLMDLFSTKETGSQKDIIPGKSWTANLVEFEDFFATHVSSAGAAQHMKHMWSGDKALVFNKVSRKWNTVATNAYIYIYTYTYVCISESKTNIYNIPNILYLCKSMVRNMPQKKHLQELTQTFTKKHHLRPGTSPRKSLQPFEGQTFLWISKADPQQLDLDIDGTCQGYWNLTHPPGHPHQKKIATK